MLGFYIACAAFVIVAGLVAWHDLKPDKYFLVRPLF